MDKWVEDIQMAIDLAEKSSGPAPEFLASSPPDNSKCGAHGPGAPEVLASTQRDRSGSRRAS